MEANARRRNKVKRCPQPTPPPKKLEGEVQKDTKKRSDTSVSVNQKPVKRPNIWDHDPIDVG